MRQEVHKLPERQVESPAHIELDIQGLESMVAPIGQDAPTSGETADLHDG